MAIRRNPETRAHRETVRDAVRAQKSAADLAQSPLDETGGMVVGANDPVTGDWHPLGLTEITLTSDPFYSAPW